MVSTSNHEEEETKDRLMRVAQLIKPTRDEGAERHEAVSSFNLEDDKDVFHGLGARIISGRPELGHFDYLSPPGQAYPYVIGSESLSMCVGKSVLEMLKLIGFDYRYIRNELNKGVEFRMVLFAADEEFQMVSPTWDGLLALTRAESEVAGDRLEKHLPLLRTKPYDELVKETGIDFDYMARELKRSVDTIQKYASLPEEQNTLANARAFLRATWYCTRLFAGDGYTVDEFGNRGVREYICQRRKVADIRHHVWINLPLDPGDVVSDDSSEERSTHRTSP